MSDPQRIQLSRARGWRKPPGAVVVSRPGKWGNPFTIDCYAPLLQDDGRWRALAVFDFETALMTGKLKVTVADVKRELAGKSLGCWCQLSKACHADVLLRIANGGES